MTRFDRRTFLKASLGAASATTLSAPNVMAQPAPLRIGVMFPVSGPQAIAGQSLKLGSEIAVEQINRAGGLLGRTVEIVFRDDQGTGPGAIAATRELNDMGVKLMVGGSQSPMALAIAPLLPESKIVLSASGTSMSLTHEQYNPYFFRVCPHSFMIIGGLGRVLGQKFPEVNKWSMLAFDSAFGRDSIAALQHGLKQTSKAKLAFENPIFVSANATDFKTEISNIMASDSEGLFVGLLVGPAISFFQQARAAGLTKKLKVIGEAGSDVILARAMKDRVPSNMWARGFYYPTAPSFTANPVSNDLYKIYQEKTGDKNPLGFLQIGHRLALALIEGVKKANSPDTAAVITAMEGMEFDTAEGKCVIRKEDHQLIGPGYYGSFLPSDQDPGFKVGEVLVVNDGDSAEPAAPGKPFTL